MGRLLKATGRTGDWPFFVHYLTMHRDAPRLPDFVPPKSDLGLYQLAGYTPEHKERYSGWNPDSKAVLKGPWSEGPSYYRFIPFVRAFPQLREWLCGPEAYVAPDAWPAPVAEVMPAHITPLAFELGCFPSDRQSTQDGILYHAFYEDPYGVGALQAWARGWRVEPRDWPHMAEAAQKLQTLVPFLLWAYPVQLETVALPHKDTRTRGIFDVYQQRAVLMKNPMSATRFTMQWGLPEWAQDLDNLMNLPPAPFDPFRSSHTPHLAATAEPRAERWFCWTPERGAIDQSLRPR